MNGFAVGLTLLGVLALLIAAEGLYRFVRAQQRADDDTDVG